MWSFLFLLCSYMYGMTRNTFQFLSQTRRLNFCSETSLLRKYTLRIKADIRHKIVMLSTRISLPTISRRVLTKTQEMETLISTWFGWFCWMYCFNTAKTARSNLKLELIQVKIGKMEGLIWYLSHFLLLELFRFIQLQLSCIFLGFCSEFEACILIFFSCLIINWASWT